MKALGANNYSSKTPDIPALHFGLHSQSSKAVLASLLYATAPPAAVPKPSCLALLRKPSNFSSPCANDKQQANDSHSPEQDSWEKQLNKRLPLCG